MSSIKTSRIILTIVIGIVIYLIAGFTPKLFLSQTVHKILTTQGLELVLALLAIVFFGKAKFREYGFCLPEGNFSFGRILRWAPVGLLALFVGMIATLGMVLSGGIGNPIIKELSIPQIILFVWVFSSIIEEIFTRGFLQSSLYEAGDEIRRPVLWRFDLPTLISALFFSAMHLTLAASGADWITIPIILLFTFTLGLIAAHQRARTGSLVPAIAVHFLGNVGGMIGGIIYGIITFIKTGHAPGM